MPETYNIRASSIASIIDCPLRGLSIQLGLVKQLPSTPPAIIGSACHESTAAFDKAKIDGSPISSNDAADVAIKYLEDPPGDVDWGPVTMKTAKARALGVHSQYCADIAESVITYDRVELPLTYLPVEVEGIVINLTGTLDRVYKIKKKHGILDIKTGMRACTQKPGKHKAQLGVYQLLAEHTLGQPIKLPGMIARLQTSDDYEVDFKRVIGAKTALVGKNGQPGLLTHIARMLKTGDFYGNSSSWLCSEKYCPLFNKGCIFK